MARVATVAQPSAKTAPRASTLRNAFWSVAPLITPALALIAWEIATRCGDISAFMLPSIGAVARRLVAELASGDFVLSAALTLYRPCCGFAIAAAGGVGVGMLMGRRRWGPWFFG